MLNKSLFGTLAMGLFWSFGQLLITSKKPLR